MIFKKPYAFFIRYFRVINLVLALLVGVFIYKLSLIHNIIEQIYFGNVSNYSNLSSEYIGFVMYLLIFIIVFITLLVLLLLRNKKKPFKDYVLLLIYIIVIIIYLYSINNLFYTLIDSVVEQTTLGIYSDISFLIYLPLFYFFIRYILLAIGFDLKKFNFTKDIVELKAEEADSEEVELILGKDSYKYKRSARKYFREFKYYILENKFFVTIILAVLGLVSLFTLFSFQIFDNNKVKIKEAFVSKSISYTVNSVYETKYDLNNNIVKEDYKFVIANINVKNLSKESKTINFKDIRLFYKNEYVYANNYFNNYFTDLGKPYNDELLLSGKAYNYLFIFKVPNSYKSKKYKIKFYNGISYSDEGINGIYKTLSIRADNIDYNMSQINFSLGDNFVFDKNKYNNSNITIRNFSIQNNYIVSDNVINLKDINKTLLILDYELFLDEQSVLFELYKESYDFFNKFLEVEYVYNGKVNKLDNLNIIKSNINNKLFISVPYEIKKADKISVVLKLRNLEIIYNIK